MHVLHTSPRTGGLAVQAVLEAAGAHYRLAEVDCEAGQHRSAEFLKLNPLGQVPVLELPDGLVMTETAAMVIHLADSLAPGRLAPHGAAPERPVYLRWLVFMAVNLYTANLRAYYPDRYTPDPAGAQGVKQSALDHLNLQFAIVDQAIGANRFLVANVFSAADPYLVMLVHWHPESQALLARHANLARLCDTVREVPAVKAANAYHQTW
jgi:glutathione S-transferase